MALTTPSQSTAPPVPLALIGAPFIVSVGSQLAKHDLSAIYKQEKFDAIPVLFTNSFHDKVWHTQDESHEVSRSLYEVAADGRTMLRLAFMYFECMESIVVQLSGWLSDIRDDTTERLLAQMLRRHNVRNADSVTLRPWVPYGASPGPAPARVAISTVNCNLPTTTLLQPYSGVHWNRKLDSGSIYSSIHPCVLVIEVPVPSQLSAISAAVARTCTEFMDDISASDELRTQFMTSILIGTWSQSELVCIAAARRRRCPRLPPELWNMIHREFILKLKW